MPNTDISLESREAQSGDLAATLSRTHQKHKQDFLLMYALKAMEHNEIVLTPRLADELIESGKTQSYEAGRLAVQTLRFGVKHARPYVGTEVMANLLDIAAFRKLRVDEKVKNKSGADTIRHEMHVLRECITAATAIIVDRPAYADGAINQGFQSLGAERAETPGTQFDKAYCGSLAKELRALQIVHDDAVGRRSGFVLETGKSRRL